MTKTRTKKTQTNLNPFRLYLSLLRILVLINTANKTWTKSFWRSSRPQIVKENHLKGINLKPNPSTFIAIGITWSGITSINSTKTISLLLKPLDQTESRLQLHFLGSNQFPLVIIKMEARREWLGPYYFEWAQKIFLQGPRRLPGLSQ